MTSSVNSVVEAWPPRSAVRVARRDGLERRLADRPSGRARVLVVDVGEERGGGEDHRHRVRDVLALERGRRAVRGLGHERARRVVLVERDEQGLRACDRAEQGEHEVGEDVSVAVQRRDDERLARRSDQERERRVDELRLVGNLRMALCGGVHLLLEHALVDGADRVLGPAEDLRLRALGMAKGELGDRVADAPLDALGAGRRPPLRPRPRATPWRRRRRRPPCARPRWVEGSADRHDAWDAASRADDHVAADLLPEDAVGAADVVLALGGDRRGLQPEAMLADRAPRPRGRPGCPCAVGLRGKGRSAGARARARSTSGERMRTASSSSSCPVSSPSRMAIVRVSTAPSLVTGHPRTGLFRLGKLAALKRGNGGLQ